MKPFEWSADRAANLVLVPVLVPWAALTFTVAGCAAGPAPSSAPSAAATVAPSRGPACVALARACHSHDADGPVAHECHELGHAAPSEERCLAKKDECMKVCGGEARPH